jgi:hypothetical protein
VRAKKIAAPVDDPSGERNGWVMLTRHTTAKLGVNRPSPQRKKSAGHAEAPAGRSGDGGAGLA